MLIFSGLSILLIANIPNEMLNPSRYDDVTLKGGMGAAIVFLVYAVIKLIDKIDKKDIVHKEEIRRLTETFINSSTRREEELINAQNLFSERMQGMTFSIDKMNTFCDTIIKKATEEVMQNGLKSLADRHKQ